MIPGWRRFKHRPKRIRRRQERDTFRHHIMPISYLISAVGVVGTGGFLLHYAVADHWMPVPLALFLMLALLPLVFAVVRFVRGHFNEDLDEP